MWLNILHKILCVLFDALFNNHTTINSVKLLHEMKAHLLSSLDISHIRSYTQVPWLQHVLKDKQLHCWLEQCI